MIDLNDAVRVIRAFLKGFDKKPIHEQKEILRDALKCITVHLDKLVLEIYGKEKEDEVPFDTNEGLPAELAGGSSELEHCRTAVRTAFRVVEVAQDQTHKPRAHITHMILFDFHPNRKSAFSRFASRFTAQDARYAR